MQGTCPCITMAAVHQFTNGPCHSRYADPARHRVAPQPSLNVIDNAPQHPRRKRIVTPARSSSKASRLKLPFAFALAPECLPNPPQKPKTNPPRPNGLVPQPSDSKSMPPLYTFPIARLRPYVYCPQGRAQREELEVQRLIRIRM